MNTLQEDFVALLLADAGISALVSTRINWGISPQGTSNPLIVLNVISGGVDYLLSGPQDLKDTRIQADVYALDYLGAWNIARAIEAKLSGLNWTTVGNTQFQGVFQVDAQDFYEFDATTDKEFRVRMDFMLHHRGV
jgi:hypothetical protein